MKQSAYSRTRRPSEQQVISGTNVFSAQFRKCGFAKGVLAFKVPEGLCLRSLKESEVRVRNPHTQEWAVVDKGSLLLSRIAINKAVLTCKAVAVDRMKSCTKK